MISSLSFLFVFVAAHAAQGIPSRLLSLPFGWVGDSTAARILPLAAGENVDWILFGGIVGAIIIAAALVKAWQFLTGRSEPQHVVTPQPMRVTKEPKHITEEHLEERLKHLVTREEIAAMELRIERRIDDNFRSLDNKRSTSIGNLHEKVEATADGLRAEINEVRRLIAELPNKVVELLRTGRR